MTAHVVETLIASKVELEVAPEDVTGLLQFRDRTNGQGITSS